MATKQKVKDTLKKKHDSLKKKPNVVGTAVGKKIKAGKKTKDWAVVVFVKEKVEASALTRSQKIPKTVDGVPTDVVAVGEVVAQQTPKGRFRPAPGGVSVGHFAITAGTLGKWVTYNNVYHILSNNHVLANSNNAAQGDNIIQPGNYDAGQNPADKIAELSSFVPIDFNGNNLVDAALAVVVGGETDPPPVDPPEPPSTCSIAGAITKVSNFFAKLFGRQTRLRAVLPQAVEDYVDDTIMNIGNPTGVVEGEDGMLVKKMGRTTGLTHGEILYTDATINVSYGEDGTATFVDQLVAGAMSAGGDSGSIVVTEDGQNIVGLLFAGSDTHTIFNRIQNVVDSFPGMELL